MGMTSVSSVANRMVHGKLHYTYAYTICHLRSVERGLKVEELRSFLFAKRSHLHMLWHLSPLYT